MPDQVKLEDSLRKLSGIGPHRVQLFEQLGLGTIGDLLFHFPRRWEDRNIQPTFNNLSPGTKATVRGWLMGGDERRPRPDMTISSFNLRDKKGNTIGLVFFNQPFRKGQLNRGREIIATGKVEERFGQLQMNNPKVETTIRSNSLHYGRIVPIYPASKGLSSRLLRTAVHAALKTCNSEIKEIIPPGIRKRHQLFPRAAAIREMHFPTDWKALRRARHTLAFEELLLLQLGILQTQANINGISHQPDGELVAKFLANLPFRLTQAQERAIIELARDMEGTQPMNRLLQGDVGSGKTIIAAYALVKSVENGYQGVLMVPTEILAEQHYLNLCHLFKPLGLDVTLLSGSITGPVRDKIGENIRCGKTQVVVGTHAVIQEGVEFANLGVVVIDEQHRFGVSQRSHLLKKGDNCDLLTMTATPIPRTLALVFYSKQNVTILDELPPGRRPVKTYWIGERARPRVYEFLRRQVLEGRQAYIVCPLIEESEKLEVRAATELLASLRERVFPELRLGLIHGKLALVTKEKIMAEFQGGKIDILISTTVIEVGIDVPNASIIIIENAERFGLAQLHQLRGRVGRGTHDSYCFLLGAPSTEEGKQRLEAMTKTSDGFRLAEMDLKMRGPGELLGTQQSGLPVLKVANLIDDIVLMDGARKEARDILLQDPTLRAPEHIALQQSLPDLFGSNWHRRRA